MGLVSYVEDRCYKGDGRFIVETEEDLKNVAKYIFLYIPASKRVGLLLNTFKMNGYTWIFHAMRSFYSEERAFEILKSESNFSKKTFLAIPDPNNKRLWMVWRQLK